MVVKLPVICNADERSDNSYSCHSGSIRQRNKIFLVLKTKIPSLALSPKLWHLQPLKP